MGMQSMHDPGFMVATARLQADQNLEEASQIMLKTIENLVKEPPTKEEVERVKTRMLKDIELEMADSQSIAVDRWGVRHLEFDVLQHARFDGHRTRDGGL